MTKHAVVGLSTSLRVEAASHGVRVSVVCPGVIDTPLLDKGNPPDLPAVASLPDGRRMLSRSIGTSRIRRRRWPTTCSPAWPGTGRSSSRPRSARAAWAAYRLAPELVVRSCRPAPSDTAQRRAALSPPRPGTPLRTAW